MSANEQLTTAHGSPIGDNQNALTAGPRGPLLMQDYQLLEKMATFNRERVPERVVHAKGSGAYGTFTVTNDVSRYTKASLFSQIGKQTDCLVRFSTVAGERGAADAERDVRGFAVKFYTEVGNWDMVGNNTPVFFVRDPYKFGDFIHTQKRDPKTNLRSNASMWDFWSLSPESLHQVTILMSDRGLPQSYRFINGYSSHAYSFINADNERFWIKLHFKTLQGIKTWTNEQAAEIVGKDRESSQRDLFNAIEQGDFPGWRVCAQIMPEADADACQFNPFDLTKVWPHGDYPLIEIGVMQLDRNPQNYFADIEQAAFEPSNIVPGIGFSPDKMLQARIMSYADAHRYRIGVNYAALPANQPQSPVHTYHRDGKLRFDGNYGGAVNYEPNSMGGPVQSHAYDEPPLPVSGKADRYDHRDGNDDYSQPGALFRLMSDGQKAQLFGNIAQAMEGVPQRIKARQLVHFYRADPDYARGVAERLGMDIDRIETLSRSPLDELFEMTSAERFTDVAAVPA